MKVLLVMPHVVEDLQKYGIPTSLYRHHRGYEHRYAKLLRAAGIDMDIMILSKMRKVVEAEFHDYGHRIIYLPVKGGRVIRMLGLWDEVRGLVKGFDIVHSTSYYSNLHDVLTLSMVASGRPLVAQSQGIYPELPLGIYLRKLLTLRFPRLFLTLNSTEAMNLNKRFKINPKRIMVIPNFIDFEERTAMDRRSARELIGVPQDERMLLTVTRLEKAKGVQVLLRALAEMPAGARPSLIVVGDGPYMGELRTLAAELRVEDKVKFTGYISNKAIDPYYAAADAFVLPSLEESFGIVILEAMFHGLPIIAANAWGPRDIIEDGVNGLLFEPGDHAGLANAIIRVLEDESLADVLSRGARAAINRYTPQAVVPRILEAYKEALG